MSQNPPQPAGDPDPGPPISHLPPPPPANPGPNPPPPLPTSQVPPSSGEGPPAEPPATGDDRTDLRSPSSHAGAPAWSAWQGLLGFATAMLGTLVLATLVFGVVALARGGRAAEDSPATTFLSVAVQDVVFIVVAISFAAITARPRAWHFGLRPTRFWSTVGWAALGLFTYFTFTFAYEALVQPRGRQSVAESLGVNDSTALLVLGGFAIIVMAPIAEEFFFRAFVYRSLRNSFARRLGVPAGAVLGALSVGLLFGSLHIEPGRVAQTLPLVPVLAALGVMFCLVYERTGSLFAVIALHATINSIGYLAVAENSGPVVLVFGGGMLVGCVLVPRLLARSPATQEV